MKTFYWYDFETFGLSPRISRIAQFAGIRTDENLNIIAEKMLYCKPTNDTLPSPEACAVTGITPQICAKKGIIEHQFISQINAEFSQPDTCIVGYNSIRFDDEFTRHTLYRNFLDPYIWHWKNRNTRWDILDVVRLCYALKKDHSLNWVFDDDDKPIFRLDQLAPANKIEHKDAHDALADVRATIEIARIIQQTQPDLFDYAYSLRRKENVQSKIKLFQPMLHTSGMYDAKLSCTRLTVAIAYHPDFSDRVIVFNLDQDPSILLDLEVSELQKLVFTKQSDLPDGVERLQVKELVFNKSPIFVPLERTKLDPKIAENLKIDMQKCLEYADFIKENKTKIEQVAQEIYKNDEPKPPTSDVDQSIYDGFIDDSDRKICNQIQTLTPAQLQDFTPNFKDQKLNKLLLHFKARNYPETLNKDEQSVWFETVQSRLQSGENGYLTLDDFYQSLEKLQTDHPQKTKLWQDLTNYAEKFC